jgi:cytochrome P450
MPLLRRFQKYFAAYTFSRKQSVLGPILANFGMETDLMKKYKAVSAEFHQVQQEVVNEHLKVLDEKMEPDNYVDAYLLKMRDEKSRGSSFEGKVGRRNLLGVLMDVNIAGSNTIVHVFQTLLMNMILYPDAQAKLREQVDSVLGSSRAPVLEDRKKLPYIEAFILESLREFTPAPFGFHDAVEDSNLEGHFIPKGTIILVNLWDANHQEDIWEDPMSFKPERFLNSTGDKVQKSEQVMSFSAGKRKCLGFLIAQEALFLLLTRVVQRFIVKENPDHPITSLEPNLGFFLTAPDFKTLFIDRWSTA